MRINISWAKVKLVLEGKKSLYGSVILNWEHSSLTKFECLKFGGFAIFLQSMLVKIGSTEKVQFQSPPTVLRLASYLDLG